MGIKLSSIGGLTSSQKKGLTPVEQSKLLGKLSGLSINKPILADIEQTKKTKKEAASSRGYGRAQGKIKESRMSKNY